MPLPVACSNWAHTELDRLGLCWCSVSTNAIVGANQPAEGIWNQMCRKCNHQIPPPPTPTTKAGVVCQARTNNSLISKWKRVAPMISYWMRCMIFAMRNPKSGEDAAGVIKRAQILYLRNPAHKNPFSYLTTYEKVKDQPKWHEEHEDYGGCREGRSCS